MDGDALDEDEDEVKMNDEPKQIEETPMTDVHNIFKPAASDLFRDSDAARVAVMTAGFDGVNHNINTATLGITNQLTSGFGGQRDLDVMQKLGNIEGDIWKAEGQAQLAIAQAQADINNRIADGLQVALAGHGAIRKDVSDSVIASLKDHAQIRQEVAASSAAGLTATLNTKYELSKELRDDGDKTRALITRQYEDTLNRQLAGAQDALLEQRAFARSRETEINVTTTVNQNQAQAQAQAQLQTLSSAVTALANSHQDIRQGIINLGTMVGTAQTAANTRVA